MPVPDFSPGEILTAAVMDSVGLWRVTNCTVTSVGGTAATASNGVITVGTGNTSVTVSAAFSSAYQNYRIIYTGGVGSGASTALNLQLGSATTNYFSGATFTIFATGANGNVFNNNTLPYFYFAGSADSTVGTFLTVDLFNPFDSTRFTGMGGSFIVTDVAGHTGGVHKTNASYTSFTITPTAGSITGGTIRVYGYNK